METLGPFGETVGLGATIRGPNRVDHLAVHGFPRGDHLRAFLRERASKVVGFANVLGKIVELPLVSLSAAWVSKELPVTYSDGGALVDAPKHRVVRSGTVLALQIRNQVNTVVNLSFIELRVR